MPEQRPLHFAVIGAGAWGTAVAAHLARRGQHAKLVTRRPEHAVTMQLTRENLEYLPGIKLPETLTVTSDLHAALLEAEVALSDATTWEPSGARLGLPRRSICQRSSTVKFFFLAML